VLYNDFVLYFRALPLGPDQLLLRGAMLRNTRWIFGKYIAVEYLAGFELNKQLT